MPTITATADYFQVQLYDSTAAPSLSQARLLISLGDIAEIITVQQRDICPLPGVPLGVTGVLNLRGQLIWAMDLRLLNPGWQESQRPNPQAKVTLVLVSSPQGQIACFAESLLGIMSCYAEQSQPIQPLYQTAYAFCASQFELAEGQVGVMLDTGQLFKHLQPR